MKTKQLELNYGSDNLVIRYNGRIVESFCMCKMMELLPSKEAQSLARLLISCCVRKEGERAEELSNILSELTE